jgi:hemerythrin
MAFTWTSELEMGHPVIDAQHKESIDLVNKLLEASKQGQTADKIAPAVDFLISFAKKHFSEEETMMQKSNYPDLENHRAYHTDYIKVITGLSDKLKQPGVTPAVVNNIILHVGEWFVDHIKQQDTKMVAHLKSGNL